MLLRWMQFWKRSTRRSGAPARVPIRKLRPVRPLLESLEDRLTPAALSYDDWRLQQFSVDAELISVMGPFATTQPVNQNFGSLIGLDAAFANYAYRGQGYSVAVIDTGIDYNHPDLGGGWGRRVIAGYDFVNNDNDPRDDHGHGTHVAGIIGGSSLTYSGVAPNVNFIALKVLDAAGNGNFGDVEDALQWVINHQAQYNIVAVNLSLGAGNYTSTPYLFLEDELQTLGTLGVFTAVASGNSFYSYNSQVGLAYPAVSQKVVSVGAVWTGNFGTVAWLSGARDHSTAADRVASFSQRSNQLDLVAPGAMITSTYKGGGYQAMAGTSMAAPVVAGAAVLVHQALDAAGQTANQNTILGILQSSGVSVKDGDDEHDNVINTGLTFKRIDVHAALNVVGAPGGGSPGGGSGNSAPVLSPISNKTMASGGSVTVLLHATDINNDPVTFSARVLAGSSQAYQLKEQLGLTYLGDYHTNLYGLNEKWLGGNGGKWYCILPNGELRRWAGTLNDTLTPANLVATLDATYHADPSKLWNAQSAPAVTLQVAGSQLNLIAQAGYVGVFDVEVTASDGKASSVATFTVSVHNNVSAAPPTLGPLPGLIIARGGRAVVPLDAADADGNALTFSARALPFDSKAYQLDQRLNLTFKGSYFRNTWGLNEKWLATPNPTGPQDWYCLLPNGELRRHGGSAAGIMNADNLIAKLNPAFYRKPQRLWNAKLHTVPDARLRVVDNRLVIRPPADYTGRFFVEVAVTDGTFTTKRTFVVRVIG
jgi:hypothetical protein